LRLAASGRSSQTAFDGCIGGARLAWLEHAGRTRAEPPLITMLEISIPCTSCSAPIRLDDRACSSCRAPVGSELVRAMEERALASSPELREAQEKLHSAASVVLILGLGYIGFGIVFYLAARGSDLLPTRDASSAGPELIASCAIGIAFLVLFFTSRRFGSVSMMAALFLWLALQVAHYSIAPQRLLLHFLGLGGVGSLFLKIVILVLLVRGACSALRLRVVRRRVVGDRALETVTGA
jgi:hypothetical protein